MKNHNKWLILLAAAALPTMVHANITFPNLLNIGLAGWGFIAFSLVLEFYFLYYFLQQSFVRVLLAVLAMNAVSGLIGVFKLFPLDLIATRQMMVATFGSLLNVLLLYAGMLIINTIIEFVVVLPFLGVKQLKKLFFIVLLANTISLIFGTVGTYIYKFARVQPQVAAAEVSEVEE